MIKNYICSQNVSCYVQGVVNLDLTVHLGFEVPTSYCKHLDLVESWHWNGEGKKFWTNVVMMNRDLNLPQSKIEPIKVKRKYWSLRFPRFWNVSKGNKNTFLPWVCVWVCVCVCIYKCVFVKERGRDEARECVCVSMNVCVCNRDIVYV